MATLKRAAIGMCRMGCRTPAACTLLFTLQWRAFGKSHSRLSCTSMYHLVNSDCKMQQCRATLQSASRRNKSHEMQEASKSFNREKRRSTSHAEASRNASATWKKDHVLRGAKLSARPQVACPLPKFKIHHLSVCHAQIGTGRIVCRRSLSFPARRGRGVPEFVHRSASSALGFARRPAGARSVPVCPVCRCLLP